MGSTSVAPPYAIGLPAKANKLLPDWYGLAEDPGLIPQNAIIYIPESYRLFHSRSTQNAQGRAFHTLVQQRGWTVYREYLDEGKSAHNDDLAKRPQFKEAMDDVLEGKYDVLVVHKIDRFSRKIRVTMEYFEKLGKAGVGFVSIQNDMDYTTPTGKLMLVMQGGLAEFYSDNLSQEVKKGLGERKKQGLYCGALPFGIAKGADGVPVLDPKTCPGLAKLFDLAAQGRTDLEIARTLKADAYRTTGPRGNRPFTTSSIRGIISNKFYLGFLPDGKGGWIKGRHEAFIDQAVWDQAQEMRRRRRTFTDTRCPGSKKVNALSGLGYCWHCGGRIHKAATSPDTARDRRHRSAPAPVPHPVAQKPTSYGRPPHTIHRLSLPGILRFPCKQPVDGCATQKKEGSTLTAQQGIALSL